MILILIILTWDYVCDAKKIQMELSIFLFVINVPKIMIIQNISRILMK